MRTKQSLSLSISHDKDCRCLMSLSVALHGRDVHRSSNFFLDILGLRVRSGSQVLSYLPGWGRRRQRCLLVGRGGTWKHPLFHCLPRMEWGRNLKPLGSRRLVGWRWRASSLLVAIAPILTPWPERRKLWRRCRKKLDPLHNITAVRMWKEKDCFGKSGKNWRFIVLTTFDHEKKNRLKWFWKRRY